MYNDTTFKASLAALAIARVAGFKLEDMKIRIAEFLDVARTPGLFYYIRTEEYIADYLDSYIKTLGSTGEFSTDKEYIIDPITTFALPFILRYDIDYITFSELKRKFLYMIMSLEGKCVNVVGDVYNDTFSSDAPTFAQIPYFVGEILHEMKYKPSPSLGSALMRLNRKRCFNILLKRKHYYPLGVVGPAIIVWIFAYMKHSIVYDIPKIIKNKLEFIVDNIMRFTHFIVRPEVGILIYKTEEEKW